MINVYKHTFRITLQPAPAHPSYTHLLYLYEKG